MPDLDQRRQGALPGNGSMYCAPTAVVNLMAYYANRGASQPATLDGPRNWQSQSQYGRATNTISLMGGFMETDAQDGTNGAGVRNGSRFYASLFAPGRFSINHYSCGGGDCPSPFEYWFIIVTGGTVATAYGRYNESSPGSMLWTRDGGHVVTVKGIEDPNCTASATLYYRDPANGGTDTTQSTFATTAKILDPVVGGFRGSGGGSYSFGTRYMMRSDPGRFFDSRLTIYPTFYVSNSGVRADTLELVRPWVPAGTLGVNRTFTVPAGNGPLVDWSLTPDMTRLYAITAPAPGTTPQPSKLWQVDMVTGAWSQLLTGVDFRNMTFNRFNELYVQDGATIKVYDIYQSPPAERGSQSFSPAPDAITFDDLTNQFIVLTEPAALTGARSLVRRPRLLSGIGQSQALPSAVAGDGSVAPDPEVAGQFWIAGSGQRLIFRVASSGGNLVVNESFSAPTGAAPRGLQVGDDGNVFFVNGGGILEYAEDANGRFLPVPGSIYAGLPAGGRLNLTRSRTNHDPALHEGPGWVNLTDPVDDAGVPDCYANCDMSTGAAVLTPADFTCFLGKYRQGLFEANCDGSTGSPFLTPADFTCFLNAYRSGCP
jgi:hypothetical protein